MQNDKTPSEKYLETLERINTNLHYMQEYLRIIATATQETTYNKYYAL